MTKNLSLWKFIRNQLAIGESVMLLVVAQSSGSSPGRQGFKMAVSEHDEIMGSIGGGIMEIKLVELARMKLKDRDENPFIKKQIHSKTAGHHQSGMICSGEQTILYYKINNSHQHEVDKIISAIENNDPLIFRISYTNNLQTFNTKTPIGEKSTFSFTSPGETEFIYEEKIGFKDVLYIVGGGHCALALSELMSKFDFYIHLIDDREGLNTIEQNDYVHKKHIVQDFAHVRELIPSGNNVYAIIMTVGYRTDKIVLRALHDKTFRYLGLLGSETKIKTLEEELLNEAVPKGFFELLHAPAGLRINSHSPEEIAVSIAAEIIQVKNSK